MMNTTVYTDLASFNLLAEEWDQLLNNAVTAPFFMRYIYQRIWWQCLGNDDLNLIAVRTDDGQLVGLAPLYATVTPAGRRRLSFVGCVEVSDYLDLVVAAGHEQAVHQALLDSLANGSIIWDELYLCSLPHHSITYTQFAEAARQRGWNVAVSQQNVCPVITLQDTWDDYLTGIDKKQRHEIRRKMRKIEKKAETHWYVVDSTEGLGEAVESFIALHQKSTTDKQDFWSDRMIAFFKSLAEALAQTGWLKLYFIEVNGTQAATLLVFDYNNEFLLYNSGYDPDQFANLSPGNVLNSYSIQHAIELGRKRFDFLRGDEVYKLRFGATPEPIYDLEISR